MPLVIANTISSYTNIGTKYGEMPPEHCTNINRGVEDRLSHVS
jgi:hypothetical protein